MTINLRELEIDCERADGKLPKKHRKAGIALDDGEIIASTDELRRLIAIARAALRLFDHGWTQEGENKAMEKLNKALEGVEDA